MLNFSPSWCSDSQEVMLGGCCTDFPGSKGSWYQANIFLASAKGQASDSNEGRSVFPAFSPWSRDFFSQDDLVEVVWIFCQCYLFLFLFWSSFPEVVPKKQKWVILGHSEWYAGDPVVLGWNLEFLHSKPAFLSWSLLFLFCLIDYYLLYNHGGKGCFFFLLKTNFGVSLPVSASFLLSGSASSILVPSWVPPR